MRQYLGLLEDVLTNGEVKEDRTGVGTYSLFGPQVRYNLREGFPLVTTKKVFVRGLIEELLWILRGQTHAMHLQRRAVKIWNPWATEDQCARFLRKEGDLGPIYGHQWRNFGASEASGDEVRDEAGFALDGFDQIERLLWNLKENPHSRRHIVTGWNPKEADQVALPPCHTLFQFYVCSKGRLSCKLYQRSADLFIGVPFNIASYALLTHMIASYCGYGVGDFIHSFGDAHIYTNHVEQVRLQLSREPRPLPQLEMKRKGLAPWEYEASDFVFLNYDPHPTIRGQIAV